MSDPNDVRATDTLANERTYLAYIRTALAFIAFGFVIARFSLFTREISIVAKIDVPHAGVVSTTFGTCMAVVGVVMGFLGGYRYSATDKALRQGRVLTLPASWAYAISIVIAATGILVAVSLAAALR